MSIENEKISDFIDQEQKKKKLQILSIYSGKLIDLINQPAEIINVKILKNSEVFYFASKNYEFCQSVSGKVANVVNYT